MPICPTCKDFYPDGAAHACAGQQNPPAVIHKVMSVLGPMLTAKDLMNLSHVSKGLERVVNTSPHGLAVSRQMWEFNAAFSGKGKLNSTKRNFIGEGVAARLLRAMFPTYRAWDSLAEQERGPLRAHFDANNKNPQELTPDFVITVRGKPRVADCFSLNYPKLTPVNNMVPKAKSTVQGIVAEATFKWNKYGAESVAVANLVDLPDQISNEQVVAWISEVGHGFAAYVQKENLLFFVRDPLISEFVFWN